METSKLNLSINNNIKSISSTTSQIHSPLNWVEQNWKTNKFDFNPTFMLESTTTSTSVDSKSSFSSVKIDGIVEKEVKRIDNGGGRSILDEEEEEEGSTDDGTYSETSSNPSATTEASTSTTSSISANNASNSNQKEVNNLDSIIKSNEKVKKVLDPFLIASASATPFTPASFKSSNSINSNSNSTNIEFKTSQDNQKNLASESEEENFPLLEENSIIHSNSNSSTECEWTLNESGLLIGSDSSTYQIADEILQLQLTPPNIKKFISSGVKNLEEKKGIEKRLGVVGLGIRIESNDTGNHSRHSSYSSNTTFESEISTNSNSSNSSSYFTSTTTPDRSPSTNKLLAYNHIISNKGNSSYFVPPTTSFNSPLGNQNSTYQPHSPTTSQFSDSPSNSNFPQSQSQVQSNSTDLYSLALDSFLISSTSNSLSTTDSNLIEPLTQHFQNSMESTHPLATLYGLTIEQGDELLRFPFENGISEEIWRIGLERMKLGNIDSNNFMNGNGDWIEGSGSEDGPSSGNRKYGLYKTELCRTWEEKGICRYGTRCQFAHGITQVRDIARHPKFKSEVCRTFWVHGECPYGRRCCFLHTTGSNKNYQNFNSSSRFTFSNQQQQQKNQQQQAQYSSISNLSDYFSNGSNNNGNNTLGSPFLFKSPTTTTTTRPFFSQSQQLGSNVIHSPYPLTPPQSTQNSPSTYLLQQSSSCSNTITNTTFSTQDYFSQPFIPCAKLSPSTKNSNLVRDRSCSITSSGIRDDDPLSTTIGSFSPLSSEGGGRKKLEPIGSEKLREKVFSSSNTSNKLDEFNSNLNLPLMVDRSGDKTPLGSFTL